MCEDRSPVEHWPRSIACVSEAASKLDLSVQATAVFDSYWRFAAERHAIYLKRLDGAAAPWTHDAVLREHRFTNVYRAADRVSQFLISDVQYGAQRAQTPDEIFFRTLLFKFFNKIETWQLLERHLGQISWQATELEAVAEILDTAYTRGTRLYSAAYIMPSPKFGAVRKHRNHLMLLRAAMNDGLPGKVSRATSLQQVYELLVRLPSIGRFLAFQYAIDLNYSAMLQFDEDDFVVAGPGALDGIAKCFSDTEGRSPESVIHWVTENQEREFSKRGLDFPGLFGRRLQPIDCQNLFCEISKYARVAHPEIVGVANRTRIKQRYGGAAQALPAPRFPPRWRLSPPDYYRCETDLFA